MIHHWKAPDLEIKDFGYQHDPTPSGQITPSQTSNLRHIEVIKISDKPSYDISLESFHFREHKF